MSLVFKLIKNEFGNYFIEHSKEWQKNLPSKEWKEFIKLEEKKHAQCIKKYKKKNILI